MSLACDCAIAASEELTRNNGRPCCGRKAFRSCALAATVDAALRASARAEVRARRRMVLRINRFSIEAFGGVRLPPYPSFQLVQLNDLPQLPHEHQRHT